MDAVDSARDKWGESTAAQSIAWDPNTCNLFACDDLGVLRCFNIKKVIADIGMDEAAASAKYPGELDGGGTDDEGGEEKEEGNSVGSLGMDGMGLGLDSNQQDDEEDNRNNIGRRYVKGVARRLTRTARSALPPVPIFKNATGTVAQRTTFAVAEPNDAYAYQGVDFCWALQAHSDRIASCVVTKHGCVTSGADLLVKMWTYDGMPLGVLLQSVPVTSAPRRGSDPDAEAMKQEDEELDDIIEVQELVEDPEKPNIHDMDFTAMEPGAGAEEFTRSSSASASTRPQQAWNQLPHRGRGDREGDWGNGPRRPRYRQC